MTVKSLTTKEQQDFRWLRKPDSGSAMSTIALSQQGYYWVLSLGKESFHLGGSAWLAAWKPLTFREARGPWEVVWV